jgi:hypothetical protein
MDRVVLGNPQQYRDPPHSVRRLLRARRERPSGSRAAKRDNEISPPDVDCHSSFVPNT